MRRGASTPQLAAVLATGSRSTTARTEPPEEEQEETTSPLLYPDAAGYASHEAMDVTPLSDTDGGQRLRNNTQPHTTTAPVLSEAGHWYLLPMEVVVKILTYLEPLWDLPRVAYLDKTLWGATADASLWRHVSLDDRRYFLNDVGEKAYALKFSDSVSPGAYELECQWLWLGASVRISGTYTTTRWRVDFTMAKISDVSNSLRTGDAPVKGTFTGVVTRKSVKINLTDELKTALRVFLPQAVTDRLRGIQLWLGGFGYGSMLQ
eukprot:TRINITY_DN7936_c0_g1_i1.p1 TRINITY_DN7936_c0_g1~~TRINITY_DN7936_c0_g1_i1.p1  ORF type:complete len:263 (-),score=37.93 TRINITY_DN7936_c0_g1_i1:13-801(-)